jgi:hypothetical protein
MEHRRLNRAQRVVAVVAFGFVLYFLGAWIVSLGSHLPYGSATYTNLSTSNIVGGLYPWVRFTIWMLLIATWVGVSIPLLRDRSMNQEGRLSSK